MAKHRANGEGSIRKRKDGRWEGRYTAGYDPDTGKQIFKNVLSKSQAEVKEKLKRVQADSKGIDFTRAGQYTIAEWMRVWFETYSKPSSRESASEYYRNYIENHIIPNIGEIKLEKLTSLDIQRMYNKIKASWRVQRYKDMTYLSLSNRTVRGIHMLLHNCLGQAVKERLISLNPTECCKILPKYKAEMKVIQPEQIKAYLKEAENRSVLPMHWN